MPISASRPRWWPALVWAGVVLPALAGLDGRIPITQRDLVAPPLVITNAGSYVVASPLMVDANEGVGIRVAADNVTLDLNGFALIYQGTNAIVGIQQAANYRNLTVCNGIVSGWKGSNYYGAGIAALGNGNRFEHLLLTENNNGLRAGRGTTVLRCAAARNSMTGLEAVEANLEECSSVVNGTFGYLISAAGTMVGCVAGGNDTGFRIIGADWFAHQVTYCNAALRYCVAVSNRNDGMYISRDAVVRACLAVGNGSEGINVESNGVIIRCFARTNFMGFLVKDGGLIADTLASGNSYQGIGGDYNCTITRCASDGNRHLGIMVGTPVGGRAGAGIIRDCMVSFHDILDFGKGIYVEGNGSRVDGNHLIGNDYGMQANLVTSGSNLVVRNSAVRNAYTNYDIGNGVTFGPIANSLSTPYPWANLTY